MGGLVDFRQVCEELPNGILILDRERRIRYWNRWLVEKTAITSEQALDRALDDLFPGWSNDRFYWAVDQAIGYRMSQILSQTLNRYLIPIDTTLGERHGVSLMQQKVSVIPIAGLDGEGYALIIVQDVTDSVLRSLAMGELMREFKEVSIRDPLTGLFNRRFMWEWLKQQEREAKRYGNCIGCLLIDLDYFKRLNDSYGHQRGDEILKGFADAVVGMLRESDILVRYGGEEFAAFIPACSLHRGVTTARRILEQISRAGIAGLKEGEVTCSIGVSILDPSNGGTVEDALDEADNQLYQAKRGGRERVCPEVAPPGIAET